MVVRASSDVRPDADAGSGRESGAIFDQDGLLTTKAAVSAWVGVVALAVGSLSSIMWGWPLPLDGSGFEAAPMSTSADKPSSVSVADQQMSGRFEVGKDGKLLRPSSAPIPWQPQLPPAAREETPEGMEAFIRYVLKAGVYMWMSGNTQPLESVSEPECTWTNKLVQSAVRIYGADGWVENAGVEVLSVGSVLQSKEDPSVYVIDMEIKQDAMTAYNGETLREFTEEVSTLRFQAAYRQDAWVLLAVGEVQ